MSSKQPYTLETDNRKLITRIMVLIFFLLFIVSLMIYGASQKTSYNTYYPASRVELYADSVPKELKIGLIVSYTEDPLQGEGWEGNGEGVTIAKWRLGQSGTKVETIVVSDKGSRVGAREAIDKLKNLKVSAVIALTSGSHTEDLAYASANAKLPIIFPYQPLPEKPLENTWYGSISNTDWVNKILESSKLFNCSSFVFVGENKDVFPNARNFHSVENPNFLEQVNQSLEASPNSCLVVDSSPKKMFEVIRYIRSNKIESPIFVNYLGANSAFVKELVKSNLTVQNVYMVGSPNLANLQLAEGVGFEESVATMKRNREVKSLYTETSFYERYYLADLASYEAFVALVKSSSISKSADPEALSKALKTLQVDSDLTIDGVQRNFNIPLYQDQNIMKLVKLDKRWAWVKYTET